MKEENILPNLTALTSEEAHLLMDRICGEIEKAVLDRYGKKYEIRIRERVHLTNPDEIIQQTCHVGHGMLQGASLVLRWPEGPKRSFRLTASGSSLFEERLQTFLIWGCGGIGFLSMLGTGKARMFSMFIGGCVGSIAGFLFYILLAGPILTIFFKRHQLTNSAFARELHRAVINRISHF